MLRFRVTTDVRCDLPAALCAAQGIGLLPAKTAPLPEDYLDFWRPLFAADPRPVLHVCMSSALSAAYYNGVAATELLRDEFPAAQVYVVDSRQASAGYGMLALAAAQAARRGVAVEEGVRQLERLRFSVCGCGIAPRGKELLALDAGGHLRRERLSNRQSVSPLCQSVVRQVVKPREHTLFIGHRGALQEAAALGETLREKCGFREVRCVTVSGTGILPAGGLAAFFYGARRS